MCDFTFHNTFKLLHKGDFEGETHRRPSGSARSLTRSPEQSVLVEQVSVESPHVVGDEGMQTLLQQLQTLSCLQPVFVTPVVETGHQLLPDHDRLVSCQTRNKAAQMAQSVSPRPPCAQNGHEMAPPALETLEEAR